MLSKEGAFFREFLMNELVVSIDGLSRQQLALLVDRLGLQVGRAPCCARHQLSALSPGSCMLPHRRLQWLICCWA